MPNALRILATAVVVTMLEAYTEQEAFANGRFPRAQTLVVDDARPAGPIVLRATFGVLWSRDQGGSFDWTCEQAMGFSGAWDPPLAFGDEGELYFGLERGLRSTRDGCAFRDHHGLDGELVSDLTVSQGVIWGAASTPTKSAFVFRYQNGTVRKSKPLGAFYVDTLDVAGGTGANPARVYATAIETGKPIGAHFFRSDDGGLTLRETNATFPVPTARLFVAAVDPHAVDRVFVRSLGSTGSDLLLSEDGGVTFRVVLHTDGAMFGFALDGDHVFAGSGTKSEGLFRSRDGGRTFDRLHDQVVYCLRADRVSHALYACSEPYAPEGYALAVSRDDGATFTSLGTFAKVRGPSPCDAGDGAKCSEPWAATKLMLATDVTSPVDASTALEDAAPPSAKPPAPSGGRCGCVVAGGASPVDANAMGIAVLALLLARRGSRSIHSRCPSDS